MEPTEYDGQCKERPELKFKAETFPSAWGSLPNSFLLSLFLVGAVKHELGFSQNKLVDRIPRVSSSVGPSISVLARMHTAELLSGR